jgi:PAS domain S-box-containing protein
MQPIRYWCHGGFLDGTKSSPEIRRSTSMGKAGVTALWLGVVLLAAIPTGTAPAATSPPQLISVGEILQLKSAEAAKGLPVSLRAVVTFYDAGTNGLFIHDASGGIAVKGLPATTPPLTPAAAVEVEGVTAAGELVPVIGQPRLKFIGPSLLPTPQPANYNLLMQGFADCQWVEIRGTVRRAVFEAGHASLSVDSGVENFTVYVQEAKEPATKAPWLGAEVRVRGVCRNVVNDRGQVSGFRLLVPSLSEVALDQPGLQDPFNLPILSIRDVLKYRRPNASNQMVRVQGVLTRQRLDFSIHLKDDTAALYVRTTQKTLFKVGDYVDVAGFLGFDRLVPCLESAVIRKLNDGLPPAPLEITPIEASHFEHDSELVQMEGNLVEIKKDPPFRSLTLLKDTKMFDAVLEEEKWTSSLSRLRKGSMIRVIGIYIVKTDEVRYPRVFQIAMRSPEDVQVLQTAPWWTQTYAVTAAKLLMGLAVATSIWVVLLRRRIKVQTRLIRQELQREAALEVRYRSLVETANDAIFSVDPTTGEIQDANRRAAEMAGLPLEKLVGSSLWQLAPPDKVEQWRQFLGRVQASGNGVHETQVQARKDSPPIAVEISASLMDLEGHKIVQGIFHDLTVRQRAEEALRASELSLLRSQEIGKVGSWEIDLANQTTRWSPEARRIFGRPTDQATTSVTAMEQAVHPEDRLLVKESFEQAIKGMKPLDADYRLLLPGGTVRMVHATGEVILDPASQPVKVQGTIQDITDRKLLEAQLRQAQKMEAVGRLSAGVAHDFNNIMTIILGHASLTLNTSPLSSEIANSLREISKAADRASNLTRQLLAFSRRQFLQIKWLDLNEVVTHLSSMLQRLIGENVAIQIQLKTPRIWLEADQSMMEQVLINLVVNARDAMPQGGKLLITTRLKHLESNFSVEHPQGREGCFACVEVADTGCGMSPEVISHLFEPFFTTKEVGKGTGLGLAAIYGVIQQHQGWIEVESEVGKGSTFRYFLPASEKPAEAPASAAPPTGSPGGKETILVVEDESALRVMVRGILKRYGYRVLEAANGQEALQLAEKNHQTIDLLLTDIVMPGGLSGQELANRLQCRHPTLRVILTSGYTMEIPESALRNHGSVRFLSKPYHPARLAKTVRECLDQA